MPAAIHFNDVTCSGVCDSFSECIDQGEQALFLVKGDEQAFRLARLILGGLSAESGSVELLGTNVTSSSNAALMSARNRTGLVSRQGGLISNLKVIENIMLPHLYFYGNVTNETERRCETLLSTLGFSARLSSLPAHLSEADRRIVSFVRSVLNNPSLMIYCNCFDEMDEQCLSRFLSSAAEYHAGAPERTSLYIAAKPLKNLSDCRTISLRLNTAGTGDTDEP